ncbi:MAG: bifunctional 5,10-methylenetetrahydrofolate dehydrogenase/5,10-methenyltetrahydrofolate cyclohydrolase [Clostridiales bacterium]|nr:bifunctional 5,10-methylenetetrahydrofolate dehydrogenase/5,10-methenyltetrahydrofolate cyclohydrolase [Clostridiales bacterium]
MTRILSGKEVAAALNLRLKEEVQALANEHIFPRLATVRVGAREDDISYEKGASKRCANVGVGIENIVLPEDVTQEELLNTINRLNADDSIHGILLFRPLPGHIDDKTVRNSISAEKDIDGITDRSMIGIYTGEDIGFPPCTPQACLEILDHYGIEVAGRNAVVIGRSLVVGKPAAMMLIKRNATVTICHTRTADMPAVVRRADIVIVSAGRAELIGKEYLREGQIVLDVGINVNDAGKLCGDVKYDEAVDVVEAITPVPGGVGTVTTSVLVKHVVEAAKRRLR